MTRYFNLKGDMMREPRNCWSRSKVIKMASEEYIPPISFNNVFNCGGSSEEALKQTWHTVTDLNLTQYCNFGHIIECRLCTTL